MGPAAEFRGCGVEGCHLSRGLGNQTRPRTDEWGQLDQVRAEI